MARIMDHVKEWRHGNLDPVNRMGVLVDQDHFKKVTSMIDAAKRGHQPITGGDSSDGAGVAPTIFDNIKTDDPWRGMKFLAPSYRWLRLVL